MKVLVINCGSSSLKYQVIDSDTEQVLAKGLCERIGIDGRLVYQKAGGEKEITDAAMPTHKEAIGMVLDALQNPKTGVIADLSEIDAVGHRVVHGGEKFSGSALVDDAMIQAVEECSGLAPLHNPANLIGINVCRELMPNVPMVGCFDTAFHQTMPEKAYLYAIPVEYYE
ncbi:MAG: acetate kinase, partial [Eubacterium sp.]|nr:acetate kinase [Eubacterium sp.]